MRVLLKVGGTLVDEPETRSRLASQLNVLARRSELVVVHGGGKQLTRFLEEHSISSRFINGLRVSDEPVIEAIVKVIAGAVNKELVSALLASGSLPVGLSGLDGCLTLASPKQPELGLVGQPARTDPRLLALLVQAGYLPVIACIAGDRHGNIYNVNADEMAVSCAIAWKADKLIFLTDVAGVKDAGGEVISELNSTAIRHLIDSGIAQGGMQAKLEAANTALASGISEVVIAAGREANVCRRLLSGEQIGTRLSPKFERVRGVSQ